MEQKSAEIAEISNRIRRVMDMETMQEPSDRGTGGPSFRAPASWHSFTAGHEEPSDRLHGPPASPPRHLVSSSLRHSVRSSIQVVIGHP